MFQEIPPHMNCVTYVQYFLFIRYSVAGDCNDTQYKCVLLLFQTYISYLIVIHALILFYKK